MGVDKGDPQEYTRAASLIEPFCGSMQWTSLFSSAYFEKYYLDQLSLDHLLFMWQDLYVGYFRW